jgi:hypothetical protein
MGWMRGKFAPVLALPIVLSLAAPGGANLASARADAQPTPAPDPWATLRGCQAVLGRFASCSADKKFRAHRDRWVAAAAPMDRKASPAEITRRLKSWARGDGRRAQCATWARREGASEHVGEGTPLALMAAQGKAVPCETFARKIGEDGWIPAALVDSRID